MATWLIKGKAKKQHFFIFHFWEIFLEELSKMTPKWVFQQKNAIFFFLFFLLFSELVLQNELRFSLCSIKCIKMLLLRHTNKIFNKFSNFYLQRLRRSWQCWHGVPLSGPRPAKNLVAPAMKAVLISPEFYQGVKISKCSNNMYPKTP